jgi:N,N'-diacetyllegionaminate synthase
MNTTLIIAEAGVNHNGDLELAKRLIEVAAEAGADIVKFQKFHAESIVSRKATKAEYQIKSTGSEETQLQMIKKLELDLDAHRMLMAHAHKNKIRFLSSPFDMESIDELHELGIDIFKIPSGEITNLPFLKKIGSFNKKVILSTGMSDMSEIEAAMQVLMKAGTTKNNISVLHCNTEYPTPFGDVNLKAMLSMKEKLGVETGYSDHTTGIEVPVAAVALGATIIEKHFTLDKNMQGPDHAASLSPTELKDMVSAIRNIEAALGDGIKKPSASEAKNMAIARKSLVASKNIKKGETFSIQNLTVKRPGSGISPMRWEEVMGKTAIRDFSEDELIEL